MKSERFRLAGILFMVAGALFLADGVLAGRSVFFVLGCAFIALGGVFLALARRPTQACLPCPTMRFTRNPLGDWACGRFPDATWYAPGGAQDAADSGEIYFFGDGEVEKRGAGRVAGEGGGETGSLVARYQGSAECHRRSLASFR